MNFFFLGLLIYIFYVLNKNYWLYIRAVTITTTHDSVRITIFSWGGGEKKEIFKQYFLLITFENIINWTPKNKINYAIINNINSRDVHFKQK